MVSGDNYMMIGGVYDYTNKIAKFLTVSYHSTWKFDSTTELSVCSDYAGTNSIGCTVQNLKINYAAYSDAYSVISFANTGFYRLHFSHFNLLVTTLGDYKLDDGSGKKLKNSQGALGSAALSSSPPTWISDGGMTFTASDQYIELPNFIPSASDLIITASVAFTFYIKVDTKPSNYPNVMTYYCTSVKYPPETTISYLFL